MAPETVINPESIKAKIQEYHNKANELQKALDTILTEFNADNTVNAEIKPVIKNIDRSKATVVGSGTFKDTIKSIFQAEGKPLITKQAMALYTTKTGKVVNYKSFSGAFSGLSTRGTLLKKIEFPENPIESRYYYGLGEWFNGEILKAEYMEKIKAA
jgi:hypothetical protein